MVCIPSCGETCYNWCCFQIARPGPTLDALRVTWITSMWMDELRHLCYLSLNIELRLKTRQRMQSGRSLSLGIAAHFQGTLLSIRSLYCLQQIVVCFHSHSYSCMPHLTIIFIQCPFPCMLWEYACFSRHVGTRMCGCLCTCVCMCTRRCKVDVGNLPGWLFCLIYWGVTLSQTQSSFIWLVLFASLLWGSSVSLFQGWT